MLEQKLSYIKIEYKYTKILGLSQLTDLFVLPKTEKFYDHILLITAFSKYSALIISANFSAPLEGEKCLIKHHIILSFSFLFSKFILYPYG